VLTPTEQKVGHNPLGLWQFSHLRTKWLLDRTAEDIASEYQRIQTRVDEDPGTAGDQGEENWAEVLRRYLRATYHVRTKGRIITSNGSASRQIDVLVLSPSYPVGLLNTKTYDSADRA
jgi:hypothetical protein